VANSSIRSFINLMFVKRSCMNTAADGIKTTMRGYDTIHRVSLDSMQQPVDLHMGSYHHVQRKACRVNSACKTLHFAPLSVNFIVRRSHYIRWTDERLRDRYFTIPSQRGHCCDGDVVRQDRPFIYVRRTIERLSFWFTVSNLLDAVADRRHVQTTPRAFSK
jgi:hypothetical protein